MSFELLSCILTFTVVVVDAVGVVVGHVLVVLDQDLTAAAALGGHEVDQDLLANDPVAGHVANQRLEIDPNLEKEKDLENVLGTGQDLDQGTGLEKGQGKGHVVVQVVL